MKKICKTDKEFLEIFSEVFVARCDCKVCVIFRKQILKEYNSDWTCKK